MPFTTNSIFTAAFLALTTTSACAQPTTPALQLQSNFLFENDAAPWVGLGKQAVVSIRHAPEEVKNGTGALRFDYGVQAGDINALIMPLPLGSLSDTKAITFWIRSDYDATLFAMMPEQNGGRYAAMFGVQANKWQRVELSMADFLLLDGANDPPDADAKLDLDQVGALAISDLGQVFAGATDPVLADLLGLKTGAHSLWLDDLALETKPLPLPDEPQKPGEVSLEPLSHPQLAWSALGGAKLGITTSPDLPGRSLGAKTVQKRGAMTGLSRRLQTGLLRGASRLAFEATSDKTATLVVILEESRGGKYQAVVPLDGGRQINMVSLDLTKFKATDDSKDANGRLDLEQIHQITVLDVTGLGATPGGDNTLTFNNLRAVR